MADGCNIFRSNCAKAGHDVVMATGQTTDAIRIFDSLNNLVQSFPMAVPSLAAAVILAPDSPTRNLIQPTRDDTSGLILRPHSALGAGTAFSLIVQTFAGVGKVFLSATDDVNHGMISAINEIGNTVFRVGQTNGFATTIVNAGSDSQTGFAVIGNSGTTTADLAQINEGFNANPVFGVAPSNGTGTTSRIYQGAGASDDSAALRIVNFDGTLPNSVDATYTSRWTATMLDHAGSRECLRLEADGAAPRMSVLGKTPAVVRQTNGTAAALAAIVDANVKSFLTALSNGLVNFGFFAAPA